MSEPPEVLCMALSSHFLLRQSLLEAWSMGQAQVSNLRNFGTLLFGRNRSAHLRARTAVMTKAAPSTRGTESQGWTECGDESESEHLGHRERRPNESPRTVRLDGSGDERGGTQTPSRSDRPADVGSGAGLLRSQGGHVPG